MNRIPTIDVLEDSLQRDMSWRRKEIANLYLAALAGKGEGQSRAIRSGIVLTYAHLEGFTRQAARNYFSFVRGRNLPYRSLAHSFLAMKVAKMASQGTAKASYYKSTVKLLVSELDQEADLPEPEAITAKSNLSFAQLSEILYCINISPAPFSLKEKFLNDVLLERRNAIAHGEFRKPTLDDYIEIHNGVFRHHR